MGPLVSPPTTPMDIGVFVIDFIPVSIVKTVYQKRAPQIGGVHLYVARAIVISTRVMMEIVIKPLENARARSIDFSQQDLMSASNVIAIRWARTAANVTI